MKLTKIKLINWHLFTNHTIDVKGNVLITGENASGKSTLMDAIYFVLSAGDKKHFNKAANESGQRNLETYIRGKLGLEKHPYLRTGNDITSYVVLEYVDKHFNHLCLGACIEIVAAGEPKSHFFILNDYEINDADFIENKRPLTYTQFKNRAKTNHLDFKDLGDTRLTRSKAIGRDLFKLDNYNRYFDLLQNAISFKPISEVSSFVNSFLLAEDNINLDSLKEEIRSYQNIHNLLIREKEKIELLKPFVEKAERFVANTKELKYLKALQSDCTIEKYKQTLKRLAIDRERIEDRINQINAKKNQIELDIDDLNNEIFKLENNEGYLALKEKYKTLEENKNKLTSYQQDLNAFKDLISKEMKIVRSLDLNYRFDEDFRNQDFGLLKAHLANYEDDYKRSQNEIRNNKSKAELKLENNNIEIKELNNQLVDLKKGINNYPDDVKNLMEIINDAIKTKYPNSNTFVLPFCEYLEVVDEKWRNALEGYLNTQRFNLLVEPKYYDLAAEAFDKYKKERKIYRTGIVNVLKINEEEVLDNSLMTKLNSKNRWATLYANYLLGRVICVDDVQDLKNYDSAITSEAMVYKNYVLKAIDPRIYKTPFIGQESIKTRITLLEQQIKALQQENLNYQKEIANYENKIALMNSSNLNTLLREENIWLKISLTESKIKELEEDISKASKEGDLYSLAMQIDDNKKKLSKLKNEAVKLQNDKDEEQKHLIEISLNDKNINETSVLEQNNLEEMLKNLNLEEYAEKKNKYSQNNLLVKDKLDSAMYTAQNYNNGVSNDLLLTMQKYATNYKPVFVALLENIEDYINEYYNLCNRGVVQYEMEAKDAYERAQASFREDFISKLHEKIKKSQEMLDGINKNLKLHPFGNDEEIYRFNYEPTKDNEFNNYYRIIMSGKLMEAQDLFTEVLDEKDNSIINDLFNKISMETDNEQQEAELARYLDYRNYMSYDIKITNKYGDEAYFSKINKEKSGGETQTPFYIVMASCFDELMNKNNSKIESTCQVVFDEAFNNMDESRIKSLMEFYKRLNIQIIIIVPSNRISAISPYMDTLIGIVKIDNYPNITIIEKKE